MSGRPTKYSEDIITLTQGYIDSCADTEEQVISGQSDKFTTYKTKITVNLPSIEGLALHLKIHRDTIHEWEKQHPAFSDILNVLRSKQAVALINRSLSGDYNPLISRLLLTKHGYTEKQEIEHSGDGIKSFLIEAASKPTTEDKG